LGEDSFLKLPVDIEVAENTLDGNSVYHFVWDQSELPNSQNYRNILQALRSSAELDQETEIRNTRLEYWIDSETYYLRKAEHSFEISSSDSGLSDFPLESDFSEWSGVASFSKFNEPVQVTVPVILKPRVDFLPTSAILEKTLQAMTELQSFHHVIKLDIKSGEFELPILVEGDFQAPNSIKQTMTLKMLGLEMTGEFIKIGDRLYEKEPMGEWLITDEFGGIDPTDTWMDSDNVFTLPIASEPIISYLDGFKAFYIKWDLSEGSELENMISLFGLNDEGMPNKFLVEYWIDTETYHLGKLKVTMEGDVGNFDFSDMPLGSDTVNMSMEWQFSSFNENAKQITAPAALLSN
jgi:hypothetical protein